MKEKPILFSGSMVRAILNGNKTQTRRIVKPQPIGRDEITYVYGQWMVGHLRDSENAFRPIRCPYQNGQQIWVKETFQFVHTNSDGQRNTFNSSKPFTQHGYRWIEYAATPKDNEPPPTWKPSIFMPRWASRIDLEIASVRVERLQDISHRDALAEGVEYDVSKPDGSPIMQYKKLWESINGEGSWHKNPWVWVLEFKQTKVSNNC